MENEVLLHMALCEDRHDIPQAVDGAIFPADIPDVTDTCSLERTAEAAIAVAALAHYRAGETEYLPTAKYANAVEERMGFPQIDVSPGFRLVLYVTGVPMALAAVITVCLYFGINFTLMHYDRGTEDYYPQEVLPF